MLKNIKKVSPGMKFTCNITGNSIEIERNGFFVLLNGKIDSYRKLVYDTYEEAYELLCREEPTFRDFDTIVNEALESDVVVYDQMEDNSSDRLFDLVTACLYNLEDEIVAMHASQEMLRHLHFGSRGVFPFRQYKRSNCIFHDEFMWDEKVVGKYNKICLTYPPNKKHLVIFQGRYQSLFGAY